MTRGKDYTMNEKIIKRIANLLSVKSIVTITLTAVFAYLAVTNKIAQDFMTVYAVVIAFYFGTQTQREQSTTDGTQTTEEARRSPTRVSPGRRTPTQRIQKRGGLTPLAATPETPRRFISIAWASLRRSCGGGAGIAPEPTAAPPIRP